MLVFLIVSWLYDRCNWGNFLVRKNGPWKFEIFCMILDCYHLNKAWTQIFSVLPGPDLATCRLVTYIRRIAGAGNFSLLSIWVQYVEKLNNTRSSWHTYIHNLIANVCDVYIFNCLYLSVSGAVQDFEMLFSPLTYQLLQRWKFEICPLIAWPWWI